MTLRDDLTLIVIPGQNDDQSKNSYPIEILLETKFMAASVARKICEIEDE